jgi:plastocyanin
MNSENRPIRGGRGVCDVRYKHIRPAILAAIVGCSAMSCDASEVSGAITLGGKRPAAMAVVWLSGSHKASPLTNAVIDQRHKAFIPHVAVVTAGTTVQFPNNDSVFHNVFAYYDAKKFDLGMYPRGATRSVTFDKQGIVALLCNVHSEMGAYIVVVDTPFYVVCDRDGRYVLHDIPPGQYTAHVWHEGGETATQSVRVSDNLTLNLPASRK